MSARPSHRLAALLLASVALVAVGAPSAAGAPTALPDPGGAALDWIEAELADDGGFLTTSSEFEGTISTFPDYGLTIDAILALAAGGRGGQASATTADQYIEEHVASYVTDADFGDGNERYAGPLAKAMLMAQVQGEDAGDFGGLDLEAELRARLQTTGPDAGRFSDDSAFGDFSNGFGQALAVMALARTPDGVPASAHQFLVAQQCPGGGFRGDYRASGGCAGDASATVDATGFALMALIAAGPSCAVQEAVTAAVDWLVAGQNADGAFGGESGTNTNSTGVAAVALRSLASTAAADEAAAFIADLQLESGDDSGALSLNAAGEAAAADGVQVLERDGFRRASTQGVLAFGFPTYAEIGQPPIDPADFTTPCSVDPPLGPPTGELSVESIVAGGSLTITATGFEPGETVTATLHSTPVELGRTTADAGGDVSLGVTIPADVEPGLHEIEVVGLTSGQVLVLDVEVLGAPEPGTLPATGGGNGAAAAAGVGLLGLGGALLLSSRRRASRREAAAG